MKMRTYVILMIFVLSSFGNTAEYPEIFILRQGDKNVAFYNLNHVRYRLISIFEAESIEKGVPVAFSLKIEDVGNQEDILFYGASNLNIRFYLAEGVKFPTEKTGTNVVVGCLLGNKKNSFVINVVKSMPDDLTLFEQKKKALLANNNTVPEDYLMLGDWIDMAKKQSQIIEEKIYQKYIDDSTWAYEKALDMSKKSIKPNLVSVKRFAMRMKKFVKKMGDAPEGKASAIASSLYRDFGKKYPKLTKSLSYSEYSISEIKDSSAQMLVIIAEMYDEILLKTESSNQLYFSAAYISPMLPAVKKKMMAMGLVLFKNRWLTKEKLSEIKIAEAQEFKDKAIVQKESLKNKKKLIVKKAKDNAGLGVEKAIIDTDYLLALDNGLGLKELAQGLDEMPIEGAEYAMYQMALWYPKESESIFISIIQSKSNNLKKYAAGLLCLLNIENDNKLFEMLSVEKDGGVLGDYIDVLWYVSKENSLRNMVDIVRNDKLPKQARLKALAYLKEETKLDYGLDPFVWKMWLQKRNK